MDYLLASKLINWDDAEKSLLLTKPLGTVKHGGGIKFAIGDQGYKAMRAWIDDAIAIKKGQYSKAADLPAKEKFVSHGTEIWFKIQNTPEAWVDKLIQVNLHAWDEATKSWEADPIATSDRLVFGKGKLWQHTLTLLAEPGSKRSRMWDRKAHLPAGKYLVKVYLDTEGKTKKDWKATLGAAEFAGQAEVQALWADGYNAMTVLNASKVSKP